jgi:hypothetical protein
VEETASPTAPPTASGAHEVFGEVTLSNISLEEYNGDTELQEFLRSDLAETASATTDDVTLLGTRTQASEPRRLLQQLLVVDYKIDFANMADAEVAKENLLAGSSLTNMETYAQANGYAGLEADVLDDIDVVEVEVEPASSGEGGVDSAIVGAAAGGVFSAIVVIGLVIRQMKKGDKAPINSSTKFSDSSQAITKEGSCEMTGNAGR